MARKDTVDINASGKKITIKDVRATNMRNDPSEEIKKPKDYAKDVVGMFADGAARITNGLLRPFEPINVLANVFNGNGGVPDLRQGNQRYNEAFRYINSLIDTGVETITGE